MTARPGELRADLTYSAQRLSAVETSVTVALGTAPAWRVVPLIYGMTPCRSKLGKRRAVADFWVASRVFIEACAADVYWHFGVNAGRGRRAGSFGFST